MCHTISFNPNCLLSLEFLKLPTGLLSPELLTRLHVSSRLVLSQSQTHMNLAGIINSERVDSVFIDQIPDEGKVHNEENPMAGHQQKKRHENMRSYLGNPKSNNKVNLIMRIASMP
jgi:hypothetical protein